MFTEHIKSKVEKLAPSKATAVGSLMTLTMIGGSTAAQAACDTSFVQRINGALDYILPAGVGLLLIATIASHIAHGSFGGNKKTWAQRRNKSGGAFLLLLLGGPIVNFISEAAGIGSLPCYDLSALFMALPL